MTGKTPLDPFRPMTTRDRKNNSHAVSREVLVRAFLSWSRSDENLGYGALGYRIDDQMGNVWQGSWNFGNAADRFCQNLRKAGWLARAEKGRGWVLTDFGRERREELEREIAQHQG